MSTEQLIIELDARTAKLDAKLKKVEKQLDGVDDSTKKVDGSLKKVGKVAGVAGAAILKTGAAATALATALTAIVLSSAKNRRELELLAGQAKTSTSDFQALSFATSKYGIDAEKIADISKDIADRIGEFSAAGTGAFQDYADVMKLSKDQAREAAQEFEGLSSQEILGKMVSRMEDASVSGDKMTFVLESLSGEASKIIPLFKGNSSELKELKKRFNDVNDSLQITGKQADALRDVSNTFTLMTSSIGNATTAISATLAPAFDDFFNSVIRVVPSATKAIIDFTNSFLDPEDINSVAGVLKQLEDSEERLSTKLRRSENDNLNTNLKEAVEAEEKRIEGLKAQLLILKEHEKNIAEVGKRAIEDRFKSEEILLSEKLQRDLKEVGDDYELQKKLAEKFAEDLKSIRSRKVDREINRGTGTGEEIQAIADRFKAEEVLLAEKLNRELLMIGDNDKSKKQLSEKFAEDIKRIDDNDELKKELSEKLEIELEIIGDNDKSKKELAEKFAEDIKRIGDNDKLKKELAEKFADDIKSMREAERSEISKELLNDFDVKLEGQKSTLKLLEDERSARKEILSAMYSDDTELSAEQLKEKNSLLDKINQDYRDKIKEATQTEDAAKEEAIINELKQQEEFLNANLVSQQVFQEKLKEIIGEYSPETLDPSILEKQNQDELDLLNDKLEQQLISYESYFKDLKKLQDKDSKDKDKKNKLEAGWSKSEVKTNLDQGITLLNSLGNNSKKAHKIKQALAASNAFMNTSEGVTKALAEQNYVGAALTAATGAAQIAAILASSPNGSGGSPSAIGASPQAQIAQPQNIEEETSNLEFTEQTEGGITTQRLVLSLENGQDLFDGIIEGTEQRRRTGR